MKRGAFGYFGVSLLVLSAVAKGQEWDYTDRAREFENQRYEVEVTNPEISERWGARRFETRRYSTPKHRYTDQQFQADKIELYRSNRFETPVLDYGVKDVEWYRSKDRQFSQAELRALRNNTLHQFSGEDAFPVQIDRAVAVEEVLDKLSLADLNRFQFRRSRPSDERIPIDEAGSEKGGRT